MMVGYNKVNARLSDSQLNGLKYVVKNQTRVTLWNSCRIYKVLLVIFFITSIGISWAFVHFYWYLKKDNTSVTNINVNTETVIYWTYKW